ncbi:MAG: hypothetical protein JSU88_04845 [Nitrospinaceae bacterium]|nr:MAG: hypothetical protein JSU88_04845 [Nitrospinaceae bacterium]
MRWARKSGLPILASLLVLSAPPARAFDGDLEGRAIGESFYVFDSPPDFQNFDSELELRLGVLGNAWQGEEWRVDYELSGDLKLADGPSVQSGLKDDVDADFFRAWLRLDNGPFKIRGGRQKILFGSGAIFRPLGFFDTRDVTGVVPQTRGVDSVRSTYFFDETTLLEGWLVPAKEGSGVIAGLRGETLVLGAEAGWVAQYHPRTSLDDLPDFSEELLQLGYHFKGESHVGFWNESRLDIEAGVEGSPLRFASVLGVDYTFDVGEGLHVLAEYFFSTQEPGFTLKDFQGDRTLHQFALGLDQPVGIAIVWRLFAIVDFRDGSFQVRPQIEYAVTDLLYAYLSGGIGGNLNGNDEPGRLYQETPVFNGTESNIGVTLVAYF